MGQAAVEIVDAAERARGAIRRRQFRKKAEASTITSIEDPRTAAVVLMVAVATSNGPMKQASERQIRGAMQAISVDRPDEELIFAKWATTGVADLNNLVSRLSRLWTTRLSVEERRELHSMVKRVALADDALNDIQLSARRKLHDGLGLAPEPMVAVDGSSWRSEAT
jgi:uncharacterized tellurite resistance protein B-like protein